MPSTQLACPHCGSTLTFGVEIAAGTPVTCLICMQGFAAANPLALAPSAAASPTAVSKKPTRSDAEKGKPKPSSDLAKPQTSKIRTVQEPEGSNPALLVFTIALLFLLTAGIAFGVWKITNAAKSKSDDDTNLVDNLKNPPNEGKSEPKDNKPEPKDSGTDAINKTKDPENKNDQVKDDPKTPPLTKQEEEDLRKKIQDEAKKVLQRKNPPKVETPDPEPEKPIPVVVAKKEGAVGLEQKRINDAIDRGIEFLRKTQKPTGTWSNEFEFEVAHASLGGLTLLECKVDAKDKVIQDAARCVRERIAKANWTYELSLAVLFLDRLGDPKDEALIQWTALRILAGQKSMGAWTYDCPDLAASEVQNLSSFLQSRRAPAKGVKDPAPMRYDQVLLQLREIPVVKYQGIKKGQLPKPVVRLSGDLVAAPGAGAPPDNSNTQFAILALWAARRHDVNVDPALLVAWKYFMSTQNEDGGWGYKPGENSKDTMVNVGLLGLALGHGASPEFDPANPKAFKPALQDKNVEHGLQKLARYIGEPVANPDQALLPMQNVFLLWCIERVAVLYDLPTIGGKDWYSWGAQVLVRNQRPDGAWMGAHYSRESPPLSTCFALLFLRRSNLVQDLTNTLRLNSAIRDPG
jgi:hypothetical protein